ncbi:unnamed protein product [Cylicocyclus nassatus]|uniref:SCP domain-containing protein n=1 Tax=Cylicocyclus nassatus TaxID=53992 RepID=A0AA36DKV9_CYLNA|nr:unnamed protein product [Cylicocyclus nassatus]
MYLLVVLSVVTASAAICPANNGMNDTIRQKFLDVHNELRRLVASGKAEDGAGGNAPQAAAMPELTYDCEVENLQISESEQLRYKKVRINKSYTAVALFCFVIFVTILSVFIFNKKKQMTQLLCCPESESTSESQSLKEICSLTFTLKKNVPPHSAICPTNDNGMNDTIRQKFLDVHNELRALVASGRAKDGLGGYAPPAAAMDKLVLFLISSNHHHIGTTVVAEERKYTGENLFMQTPAFDSKLEAAEDASRWWFAELEEFGVGTDLIYGDALWGKGVGHYTQMVWQTTTAIGCAIQNCGAKTIVVCNYDPS